MLQFYYNDLTICEEWSRVTISLPGEYLFTLCISITVTVLSQEFVVISGRYFCYLLYAFLLYLCIGCPGHSLVHPSLYHMIVNAVQCSTTSVLKFASCQSNQKQYA